MRFLDLFPIPKYLAMPAFGIDLAERSFKYLRFRNTAAGARLASYGEKAIPEGLIEKGGIKDAKELSAFLKKNCRELGIEHAVAALPDEKAFISLIALPKMEEKFLRGAIESQLEEHIPLTAEEALFDYDIVEQDGGAQEKIEAIVVAYPRLLVESYRDVFHNAGVKLQAFEMRASALRRALLGERHKGTEMLVDFGRTHTSFIIVHNGTARFNSTILVAGDTLNEALRKRFAVDYAEAESIKEEKGMLRTKSNEEVFNALLPVASAIAEEIQRHVIYWNTHAEHAGVSGRKEIDFVKLAGGGANLSGFVEYLAYELKLPTAPANPWINVTSFDDYVPEIKKSESLIYANVIGLALGALSPAISQ